MGFRTPDGLSIPAVTSEQMREVDRIAMEDFGLGILQMMENAGRTLAQNAIQLIGNKRGRVTILAGGGGNGGGGLCCARHLHNKGLPVQVVLDRDVNAVHGAAANQLRILEAAGVWRAEPEEAVVAIRDAQLVVDALIGYSLRGAPRGRAADLIELCNQHAARVLALDLPSGMNATTGEALGAVVQAERTVTLALPKTGLQGVHGDLYLADIGIPPAVYGRLGLSYRSPFSEYDWILLMED